MTTQSHIWIIDDDDSIRWVLQKALEGAGFTITILSSGEARPDDLVHTWTNADNRR